MLRLLGPDGRVLAEDDDGAAPGSMASHLEIPADRPAGALLEATAFEGADGASVLVLEPPPGAHPRR